MQWAATHFWNADLYIFDYPEYYPLLETIRMVPQGTVIFDYHSVTPPHLWRSQHSRANVERGVEEVRLVAFADYAIAHSEYTRSELLATGLIAPERVSVVPYAVPTDRFHPEARPPAPPELKDGAGPVLLYVGRMAGNKRVDLLVQMAARVKPRYPRLRLLLVGDDQAPPYKEVVAEARRLIEQHGLQENVIFTGPRRHAELPAYYHACDIYVTGSEHEGFCIPVVEAMACGKPVVAAAATALPWTVGDAGLLFEPGDAGQFAAQVLAILDSKYGSDMREPRDR
jgi:glycosyltransferase involved in cell wall biosynthesis